MSEFVVETVGLSKAYAGNMVLKEVDFSVRAGEVHCIVGENGAGKSTLIKLLSGAVAATEGAVIVNSTKVGRMTPARASHLGIQTVYQENVLAYSMSVAENIYTGQESTGPLGLYNKRDALSHASKLMADLGIHLDPAQLVSQLSAAERQYVKILRAMARNVRVLILDEPTTMFSRDDIARVLDIVTRIRDKGVAVIYISHHLQEVVQIADRISVLRDGVKVREYDNSGKNTDLQLLVNDMVGRPVESFYKGVRHSVGDVAVQVRGLQLRKNGPEISFDIHRGEVLGIAGMVGSGRTEIVRAIFGADRKYAGSLSADGLPIRIGNPWHAIRHDFAFVTEDRQRQGLALNMSVLENMHQVRMNKSKGILYTASRARQEIAEVYDAVSIRGCTPDTPVYHLSGGNQQKVVLGKWLMVDSQFVILDEPTRGIDVNAKSEIYQLISELARNGKSILMVSSDMPELIALCDRILVMRKGAISGEIPREQISEQEILAKALEVDL